ncbi:MAG: YHS domain-containing protein, partial [Gemmatimonadota bacterium]
MKFRDPVCGMCFEEAEAATPEVCVRDPARVRLRASLALPEVDGAFAALNDSLNASISFSRAQEGAVTTEATKVTDPVCGMRFKPEKAVARAEFGGKTYYFCTMACRRRFEKEPGRYV